MKEQLQIDFENIIKTSSFTKKDIELKQNSLDEFIKLGFPNRRQENWKFSDLNQIIKKNIGDLSFYNDYSSSNKIDTSVFVDGLEHNKIVFINGRIEKIDFDYEKKDKIEIIDEPEVDSSSNNFNSLKGVGTVIKKASAASNLVEAFSFSSCTTLATIFFKFGSTIWILPWLIISTTSLLVSTPKTLTPDEANNAAVGSPMYPKPITETVLKSILFCL